jgi:hypothetical protein
VLRGIFGGIFALLATSVVANAQTCMTYPNTFSNGAVADATQVNANFNCAVLSGAPSLTGPVTATTTNQTSPFTVNANVPNGNAVFSMKNGAITGYPEVSYELQTQNPTAWVLWTLYNNNIGSPPFYIEQGSSALVFTAIRFPSINFQSADGTATSLTLINPGSSAAGSVAVDATSVPSGDAFYVNGQAAGTTAWSNTSDARLKKNVVRIEGALSLLEHLRGVRYEWRPAVEREVGKDMTLPLHTPQVGFIAQEVEKVVPEAVTAPRPGSSDVYTVQESKLIPILVEAIKEQQAQIKALQAKVDALQGEK